MTTTPSGHTIHMTLSDRQRKAHSHHHSKFHRRMYAHEYRKCAYGERYFRFQARAEIHAVPHIFHGDAVAAEERRANNAASASLRSRAERLRRQPKIRHVLFQQTV